MLLRQPHSETPKAHQHAANADDYVAQGLLVPAAEEHYKAAEAYQACVEASTDESVRVAASYTYGITVLMHVSLGFRRSERSGCSAMTIQKLARSYNDE